MFVLSPLREFSFIFRCKVCSAAGEHFKKLEILPRSHFERAKVLNDRMNLENNKATPSRKFSTREGLALVAAFGQTLQIFQDTIVSQFAKET